MLGLGTVAFLLTAESAAGFMGTSCSIGVQRQATFDSRSSCLLHHPVSTQGRSGMWNIRGNKMAGVQLQGRSGKAVSHDSDPTDIEEIWMYFANKEIGTRHLIRQPQRSQSIRWSCLSQNFIFCRARAHTHTDLGNLFDRIRHMRTYIQTHAQPHSEFVVWKDTEKDLRDMGV